MGEMVAATRDIEVLNDLIEATPDKALRQGMSPALWRMVAGICGDYHSLDRIYLPVIRMATPGAGSNDEPLKNAVRLPKRRPASFRTKTVVSRIVSTRSAK